MMEENSTDKNYLYVVSLNKFRFIMLGCITVSLFALFFFIGLIAGISSADQKNQGGNKAAAFSKQTSPVPAEFTVPDTENTDEKTTSSGMALNKPSQLSVQNSVSSHELLRQDAAISGSVPSSTPVRSESVRPSTHTSSVREIRIAETESDKDTMYYLQVFVTGDKRRADLVKNDLLSRKYKGYSRVVKSSDGKIMYAVRVGLYSDRGKALHDLRILREKGGFKDAFLTVNNRPNSGENA